MGTKRSPLLAGAQYAVCWYDRRRKEIGKWVTTVKRGDFVEVNEHRSQREGCEFIGLTDKGSPDPEYRPQAGDTGAIRAT